MKKRISSFILALLMAVIPVFAAETNQKESTAFSIENASAEELLELFSAVCQEKPVPANPPDILIALLNKRNDIDGGLYIKYIADASLPLEARFILIELLGESASLDDNTSAKLKKLLTDDTDPALKRKILTVARFKQPEDAELLTSLIKNEPDMAALALKVFAMNLPKQAEAIADELLENRADSDPGMLREAIFAKARAVKDSDENAKLEFIKTCEEILLSETTDSATKNAIASALATLKDVDTICTILKSDLINVTVKKVVLSRNEEYLKQLDFSALTEDQKMVLIESRSIYPIAFENMGPAVPTDPMDKLVYDMLLIGTVLSHLF